MTGFHGVYNLIEGIEVNKTIKKLHNYRPKYMSMLSMHHEGI